MIPGKEKSYHKTAASISKEKAIGFLLFDIEHFLRRLFKNWYWFVIMGCLGYGIAYVYNKYYTQRIYASNLSLSISNNTAAYFTPNQSINFIWGQGGNQDGIYLKKMLLSRSHNEYLVKNLKLYLNYSTKGLLKSTYIDETDSPVFVEIDENYPQTINTAITLIPKGNKRYEVILDKENKGIVYNYATESYEMGKDPAASHNRIISVNEWYTAPNLKFRLVENPETPKIKLENIIFNLVSVNDAVNGIVSSLNVDFDKEINSIMIITKKGYNLNSTVRFLNISVEELKKKRQEDKGTVDKNTENYIAENLSKIRVKLDSAASAMNTLKTKEKLYDIKDRDEKSLTEIKELESKKAELLTRINALNAIRNTLASQNIEKLININAAGVEDGMFTATVAELKNLYAKKREMATIYTSNSEPMREINRLINEARGNSANSMRNYYSTYNNELANLEQKIRKLDADLVTFPEKQRIFLDAERGYNMIESVYNSLLSKQNDTQIRIASTKSDLTVIDPAKNLGQGPIAPNIQKTKYTIVGFFLLLPFIFISVTEIFDNKIRNVREVAKVTKIPLLGVVGKKNNDNNLTVLEQSKSTISEAFRGIRSNMRFLLTDGEEHKVILVTSSVGGEGKTYISINLASVLALSGKRVILLGMDLRKPKIFGDFDIENEYGVSNYLTGDVTLDQIINKTKMDMLDIVTAGPIPPNPSELLMSERNIKLIQDLREQYDYVIIDSPPIGLVADAFELMEFSDLNIYVVRHEYTEKYMLKMIMDKYQDEEVKHLGLIYNDYVFQKGYGYGYG